MSQLAKTILSAAQALPVNSRFGVRPPSTQALIAAISSGNGEVVLLTREIFLTSGRSRVLQLGHRTVELKHGNSWQLLLGKRPAGMAVRALSWLGPEQAPSALKILQTKLSPTKWEALWAARAALPSWMARAVSEAGVFFDQGTSVGREMVKISFVKEALYAGM